MPRPSVARPPMVSGDPKRIKHRKRRRPRDRGPRGVPFTKAEANRVSAAARSDGA